MKIVVTGAHGFIGRAVTRFATLEGHEIEPFDAVEGKNVQHRYGHDNSFRGRDSIIHLAGVLGTAELFDTPESAVSINVGGALNMLEMCLRYNLGFVGITMPDSGWANIYTATKHCARDIAEAYRRHRGVRVSNVCAFNAYGPGQKFGEGHPQKILPTFATRSWAGEPIEIWGDGKQTVDLVHVDDVGRMLAEAVNFGSGETFDAGTGHALTVNEVADMVCSITGSTTPHRYLPMRDGEDDRTQIVATGRGWDLLGWKPEFRESQFIECVNWYRETLLDMRGREVSR